MNKDFNIKKILKFAIPCAILFIAFWAFVIFSFISSVRTSIANAPLDDIISNYDRGNYTKVLTATMYELESEEYKIYYDLAYKKALEAIDKNIVLENYKSAFDDSSKLRDILYADSTVTDTYSNCKSLYVDSLLSDIKLSVAKGDIDSASSSIDKVLSLDPSNEIAIEHLTNITALKEELAMLQAEEERLATEEAEALRIAEEERLALEQAEADKLAEEERLEAERIAEEKRLALEQAEADKLAEEARLEAERIALEEKIAADKATAERLEYIDTDAATYNTTLRVASHTDVYGNTSVIPDGGTIQFKHFYGSDTRGYELQYGFYSTINLIVENNHTRDVQVKSIVIRSNELNLANDNYLSGCGYNATSANAARKATVSPSIPAGYHMYDIISFDLVTTTKKSGTIQFEVTYSDNTFNSITVPFELTGSGEPQ